MGFNSFLIPGAILLLMAAVVAGLAIYRFLIAREQEFHLHASADEAQAVGHQLSVAKRLDAVDRWGKLLTTITFVYFVFLAAWFLYQEWVKSNQLNY